MVQSIKGRKAQVAFGQILTMVEKEKLIVVSNAEYKKSIRPTQARTVLSVDISSRKLNFKDSVDVRGMRAAEALEVVQDLVDDANQCCDKCDDRDCNPGVRIRHCRRPPLVKLQTCPYIRKVPVQ